MDCFFVSVGLLSRPHLKNKPIAVTHHPADTPSVNFKRPGVDEEYERNYYKQKKSTSATSSHTDLQGNRYACLCFNLLGVVNWRTLQML